MEACVLILVLVLGTDTKIKWFVTFLLLRPFQETRTPTPQSQLDTIDWCTLSFRIILKIVVALFDDSLHIGSFGTYNSSGNLKPIFILNLYFISAGELYVLFFLKHLEHLLLIVVHTEILLSWNRITIPKIILSQILLVT